MKRAREHSGRESVGDGVGVKPAKKGHAWGRGIRLFTHSTSFSTRTVSSCSVGLECGERVAHTPIRFGRALACFDGWSFQLAFVSCLLFLFKAGCQGKGRGEGGARRAVSREGFSSAQPRSFVSSSGVCPNRCSSCASGIRSCACVYASSAGVFAHVLSKNVEEGRQAVRKSWLCILVRCAMLIVRLCRGEETVVCGARAALSIAIHESWWKNDDIIMFN